MRIHRIIAALPILLALGAASAARAADLSDQDLSGEWYVLVNFKDDRSEDESVKKFKDFAWSIKQDESKIVWQDFPYVMFHEDLELVRREAMRSHTGWEPSPGVWSRIRKKITVSNRAVARKTLRGSREKGFESPAPIGGAGANMISFTRDWQVTFAPEMIRVRITDSLSGGMGLDGMEDSVVYEITERAADDELRGSYREPHKSGTFVMVRSKKRSAR